jgi:hypothetical protein
MAVMSYPEPYALTIRSRLAALGGVAETSQPHIRVAR